MPPPLVRRTTLAFKEAEDGEPLDPSEAGYPAMPMNVLSENHVHAWLGASGIADVLGRLAEGAVLEDLVLRRSA